MENTTNRGPSSGWLRRSLQVLALSIVSFTALSHAQDDPSHYGPSSKNTPIKNRSGITPGSESRIVSRSEANQVPMMWEYCDRSNTTECASFPVPRDHFANFTVMDRISVLRFPAKIEGGHNNPKWRGPIFINTAINAGSSPIEGLISRADQFRAMLGDEYDLVAFDPRGVRDSEPSADCFKSRINRWEWQKREIWSNRAPSDLGGDTFGRILLEHITINKMCNEALKETGRFFGVTSIAQDMHLINQAVWNLSGKNDTDIVWPLNYWGVGHATALGMAYATMWPKHVGKFVLDGVLNPPVTRGGNHWKYHLDSGAQLDEFYKQCSESKSCPFSKLTPTGKNSSKPESIKRAIEITLAAVQRLPLFTIEYDSREQSYRKGYAPNVLQYDEALGLIRNLTLSLDSKASQTAVLQLWDVYRKIKVRDGRELPWPEVEEPLLERDEPLVERDESLVERDIEKNEDALKGPGQYNEAYRALVCGDEQQLTHSEYLLKDSFAALQPKVGAMLADIFTPRASLCAGWRFKSTYIIPAAVRRARTSSRMLFLNNKIDAYTPLTNALEMTESFRNSVLVVNDKAAHTVMGWKEGEYGNECIRSVLDDYFKGTDLSGALSCSDKMKKPVQYA